MEAMKRFLEANEGRSMAMAVHYEGVELVTSNDTLALGGHTFLKKIDSAHFKLFSINPVNHKINMVVVDNNVINPALFSHFKT